MGISGDSEQVAVGTQLTGVEREPFCLLRVSG
jgi:hypothetical protein